MRDDGWLLVTAWSKTFSHFPHITFGVQPTLTDLYHLTDVDVDSFRHKKVRRRRMAMSRVLEVLVELERNYYLIEPSDIHALQDPPPREVGMQPVIVDDTKGHATDKGAQPARTTGPGVTDPEETSGRVSLEATEGPQAKGAMQEDSVTPGVVKKAKAVGSDKELLDKDKKADGSDTQRVPPTSLGDIPGKGKSPNKPTTKSKGEEESDDDSTNP
jgi:hypothetical protein